MERLLSPALSRGRRASAVRARPRGAGALERDAVQFQGDRAILASDIRRFLVHRPGLRLFVHRDPPSLRTSPTSGPVGYVITAISIQVWQRGSSVGTPF